MMPPRLHAQFDRAEHLPRESISSTYHQPRKEIVPGTVPGVVQLYWSRAVERNLVVLNVRACVLRCDISDKVRLQAHKPLGSWTVNKWLYAFQNCQIVKFKTAW